MGRSRRSVFSPPPSWFVRLYDAESSESLSCCVFLLGLAFAHAVSRAEFFLPFRILRRRISPLDRFWACMRQLTQPCPCQSRQHFCVRSPPWWRRGRSIQSFRRWRAYMVPGLRKTENLGSYEEIRLRQKLTMGIMQLSTFQPWPWHKVNRRPTFSWAETMLRCLGRISLCTLIHYTKYHNAFYTYHPSYDRMVLMSTISNP